MDTQKKESYKKIIAFTLLLIMAICLNASAQSTEPARVLIDSYELSDKLTPETAEEAISELSNALALCADNTLKFRIEYRIAMVYFKAGELEKSVSCFEKITQSAECPDMVKLCSFNMAGQTYRMQAKDDKALGAFEELIKLSETFAGKEPNQPTGTAVLKLAATAGFSKAEIYRYNQNYDSEIAEYKRIIELVKKPSDYVPAALDRMSQAYLIEGKIEDYNQTAIKLIEEYPDYYRTPLVKLEEQAVKILKQKNASIEFEKASLDAPARLIALVKDSSDEQFRKKTASVFKELYEQYKKGYGGILLGYHWGWVLDATGRHDQAALIFEQICKQAEMIDSDKPGIAHVIDTLTEYAKLQQAFIYGEENKYREGLELVYSLKPDPNDVHMQNLSDSIEKALQTLKREVPKDVNDQ